MVIVEGEGEAVEKGIRTDDDDEINDERGNEEGREEISFLLGRPAFFFNAFAVNRLALATRQI